MDSLIYVLLLIPAILMIIAGILISASRRNATMSNHHFAGNFNMNNYGKRVIPLFTVSGIFLSLAGLLIVKGQMIAGIALLIITMIAFIISFSVIQKKY